MILKASLQHAEVISKLGAETFYTSHKDSALVYEIYSYIRKVYSVDAVKKELANSENIYHLVSHENTIAGFSKMEHNVKHSAIDVDNVSKMDQIYLLGAFQNMKLGAVLLKYNIDCSKSCGQNGMWLIVWVGNTTAITFYEKFGFLVITSDKFRLTNTHLNECYVMLLKY